MKIVIAPDSYKESLSALQVADAIERGFRSVLPRACYVKLPMADGGEGTVQALIDASGGRILEQEVRDPLGRKIKAFYGIMGDGQTAVIEMAAASGLHLLASYERNPMLTTSFGTGELILAALNEGATRLIIGIGGSATNDGGMGMAQALGVRFLDKRGKDLGYGGGQLEHLNRIDSQNLHPKLKDAILEVACDVDNPLCGIRGASQVFGTQKGATKEMIKQLDANLAHYAKILEAQCGYDVKNHAGSGAAGGLGAALLGLLQASLKPGIGLVMDALKLPQALKDANLIITGEGRMDASSIHGKAPVGVAREAKKLNKPVIAIVGSLGEGYEAVYEQGIDALFSTTPYPLKEGLKNASFHVQNTALSVARIYKFAKNL